MTAEQPYPEGLKELEHTGFGAHDHHVMRVARLRKHAMEMCRQYKVPQVRLIVRTPPGGGVAVYYETDRTIWLGPKRGKNLLTLAHEMAHHVVAMRHPRARDHGPTWMRYYADMVDDLKLMPRRAFLAAAREYGVACR